LEVINTLYGDSGVMRADRWQRLSGSYHGSGCTLASAIAATIARGLDIEEAVREAQDYTWHSLKFGFRPGMGQFIPDRMFWAREDESDADSSEGHSDHAVGEPADSRSTPSPRDGTGPRH
jgi:hydroxymethylpyrimidine/phosphomethylpyrimidine kinase